MKTPLKSIIGLLLLSLTLAALEHASARPRPPLPPTPPDRALRLELRFDSLPWAESVWAVPW